MPSQGDVGVNGIPTPCFIAVPPENKWRPSLRKRGLNIHGQNAPPVTMYLSAFCFTISDDCKQHSFFLFSSWPALKAPPAAY